MFKSVTQKQISNCTSVPVRTIQEWIKTKPQLYKAIKSFTTLCYTTPLTAEVWIEDDILVISILETDITLKTPYQEQYSLVKNLTRVLGSWGVVDWIGEDDKDIFTLKPIFKE